MKKKILLLLILLTSLCVASGCTIGSGSGLEAMFGKPSDSGHTVVPNGTASEDTVVITKSEYERYKRFSELTDLYDAALQMFYKEPDGDKLLEYAARGMMAGLGDPYSFYYSPEEFEQMMEDDKGEYTGIGVMILTETCTISRVFKGSPAEEAGVMRGDILYKVGEDLYVTSANIQEAVNIMRGVPGTYVDVTFIRNGEQITYNIERRKVQTNQVESTMLDSEVGYIALYEFSGVAEKEFETALKELTEQNARSIIIDLRDNHGGWVDQAKIIGDLFMDQGEICYMVDRWGNENHRFYQTVDGKIDVQLTILVNEMSASSSEILTAALKECADATVVGTQTFGKGIIQQVMMIGDRGAGFQITVAEYLTPKGNKVHETGITPDVIVERPEGDPGIYDFADIGKDVQLRKALEVAREKLK